MPELPGGNALSAAPLVGTDQAARVLRANPTRAPACGAKVWHSHQPLQAESHQSNLRLLNPQLMEFSAREPTALAVSPPPMFRCEPKT
jgi:hypothetical protein